MGISLEKVEKWREEIITIKGEIMARKEMGLEHDPTTCIKLFSVQWRVKAICYYNKESDSAYLDVVAQDLQYTRRKFDYLAHIGEWIMLDRDTQKLPLMEYCDFWTGEKNVPILYLENMPDNDVDYAFALLLEENGLDDID
jgi:hypothetical protein